MRLLFIHPESLWFNLRCILWDSSRQEILFHILELSRSRVAIRLDIIANWFTPRVRDFIQAWLKVLFLNLLATSHRNIFLLCTFGCFTFLCQWVDQRCWSKIFELERWGQTRWLTTSFYCAFAYSDRLWWAGFWCFFWVLIKWTESSLVFGPESSWNDDIDVCSASPYN